MKRAHIPVEDRRDPAGVPTHGAAADPAATVRFDAQAGELVLLDQTLLPGEVRYLRLTQPEEVREAIFNLRVRGAPAIGVAAAYGAYLGACRSRAADVTGHRA